MNAIFEVFMSFYTGIFYLLAIITVIATALAVTRRNMVHAVVYLIISFFGTALLYYLLGAPFLAVLEVIIYAGAIMVLFLFIVMMIQIRPAVQTRNVVLKQWLPAILLGGIVFGLAAAMVVADPGSRIRLKPATAGPAELGRFLFQQYWFPVEIASFLLLIALVGALYLGRGESKTAAGRTEETR
jgi:NADH-quinone oxidoreductase subunit J